MSDHAVLSASASKRWLNCPPSARLEEQFPEEGSSFAEEGSYAHSLAECKLRHYIAVIPKSKRDKELADLRQDKWWSQDLEDHVDRYCDVVKEKISVAGKDSVVLLEQRLDFSRWVPEGFGTGDVVILSSSGVCTVVDLKFGKGVPVSAEDNTQMMLYALGAVSEYEALYDINMVEMTIVQPRLDSVSSSDISVFALLEWGTDVVQPVANTAFEGKGRFASGDWCRFCRAKATCRARAEENLAMAKYDFQQPSLLSIEEVAAILGSVDRLVSWAGDVKDYALAQAESGVQYPGWKLVEGRSNRVLSSPEAAAEALALEGYTDEQIYERKMLGITALEKLLGKKIFGAILDPLVIKPAGKPVLVPVDDKRPEINSVASAQNDFKE